MLPDEDGQVAALVEGILDKMFTADQNLAIDSRECRRGVRDRFRSSGTRKGAGIGNALRQRRAGECERENQARAGREL